MLSNQFQSKLQFDCVERHNNQELQQRMFAAEEEVERLKQLEDDRFENLEEENRLLQRKINDLKEEVVTHQNSLIAADADYQELKAMHATEVAELKKEHTAVATTLAILSKDTKEVERLKAKKVAAEKAEKDAKAKLASERKRQVSAQDAFEQEQAAETKVREEAVLVEQAKRIQEQHRKQMEEVLKKEEELKKFLELEMAELNKEHAAQQKEGRSRKITDESQRIKKYGRGC